MVYEGRQLKKHKTSARRGHDAMPVFGDTFVFDVPAYQLDNVHFSICVIGVEKVNNKCDVLISPDMTTTSTLFWYHEYDLNFDIIISPNMLCKHDIIYCHF